MKYRVTFDATEIYQFDVLIEADSEEEARKKAPDFDRVERRHHEQYDDEIVKVVEVK